MTINIPLPLEFFSIDFPEANKTKKKQTRTTTNPKATKGYTCTQYTQHILIIQETLIYSCNLQTGKWLSDVFVLYIFSYRGLEKPGSSESLHF